MKHNRRNIVLECEFTFVRKPIEMTKKQLLVQMQANENL